MKLFKPNSTINASQRISSPVTSKLKYIKPKVNNDYHHPISLSDVPLDKIRIGYYSTWQIACGIAVYTEHLVNAFIKKGNNVFAYPNTLSIHDLIKIIDVDKIHLLNIQYEPAIMPSEEDLIFLIKQLHNRNIKVVFTMHSESSEIRRFSNIVDAFIFHKNPLYLKDRISVIPMGLPIFEKPSSKLHIRHKHGFCKEDRIITTTGFMFTWKQHANILEKLVPYLQQDSCLKVQLLTTFNKVNPDECIIECKNIQDIIISSNLENQIIHITQFLPQQELSERLWLSDLGYLWSGITTSSSSAAGREFVTSRLPLIATNSSHYHDLISGVKKTEMNQDQFVDTIIKTLYDEKELIRLSDEMDLKYNELNNDIIINKHIEVFLK